jgi:phospholipid/cholesterol/gamma-HCH transport system permease protein
MWRISRRMAGGAVSAAGEGPIDVKAGTRAGILTFGRAFPTMSFGKRMVDFELQIADDAPAARVRFAGPLTRATVKAAFADLKPLLARATALEIDMSGVAEIDSAGVAFLAHCAARLGVGKERFRLIAVPDAVARRLDVAGWKLGGPSALFKAEDERLAESVGAAAFDAWGSVHYFLFLASELFFHGVVAPFRGRLPRLGLFVEQMSRIGAGSAPIVLLVSVLVGLTTALQAAYQLRTFGANIYIADLVSISMLRELGPLMAAILVAGRSGASITAEIGTMKVNEEIDALTLLGVSPIEYLGVPRAYAAVVTQPLLGVLAALVGIAGGFVVALTALGLNADAYFNETLTAVFPADLVFNIMKSAVFGWIIAAVGLFYGLRVSGGAEGVGRATTRSVVASIFLIIVADCAFSFA